MGRGRGSLDDHGPACSRCAVAVLRLDDRLRREAAGMEAPPSAPRRTAAHAPHPPPRHGEGPRRLRRMPFVARDHARSPVRGHPGAVGRRVRARPRGNRGDRRRQDTRARLERGCRAGESAPASPLMAWVETVSPSFRARHESADADDVARALDSLEATRERLAIVFDRTVADVTVIFHRSGPLLDLAHPLVPVERLLTAPAARRYVVGSTGAQTIHVLAPGPLRARASAVPGSREMLERAPDVLYARLVVGRNNRRPPPPATPGRRLQRVRWSWLVDGAARYFAG